MSEQAEKIGMMALEVLRHDPAKDAPLEYRVAAYNAAAEILKQEILRQTTVAIAAKLFNK